jgi:hypothetical protein
MDLRHNIFSVSLKRNTGNTSELFLDGIKVGPRIRKWHAVASLSVESEVLTAVVIQIQLTLRRNTSLLSSGSKTSEA